MGHLYKKNSSHFSECTVESRRKAPLLIGLLDEAAEYAFDLESDILKDYDTFVHELDLRFHETISTNSYQQLFYSHKIRPNESLREYAADLKCSILCAFRRGVSPDVREEMTLKQLFDGLHDEDARYHIQALQHPALQH